MVSAVATGGVSDPQGTTGLLVMAGTFVLLMLFVFILVSKGKKVDVTKHT